MPLLKRITGDRWLAFGAAVAIIAAGAIVAIWQAKPHGGFWQVPGWLAVAALGVGVLLMLVGVLKHDTPEAPGQTQISGDQSANYQAGRDIRVSNRRENDH
jgi:hypothetical protein